MLVRKAIWWLIRVYQLTLSAMFGRHCRFEPTCSHYAQQAVMRHGVLTGGWLAAKRLARCNPWGGQGFDPVPEQVIRVPRIILLTRPLLALCLGLRSSRTESVRCGAHPAQITKIVSAQRILQGTLPSTDCHCCGSKILHK